MNLVEAIYTPRDKVTESFNTYMIKNTIQNQLGGSNNDNDNYNEESNDNSKKSAKQNKLRKKAERRAENEENKYKVYKDARRDSYRKIIKGLGIVFYILILPLLPWYYIIKNTKNNLNNLFNNMMKPL